MKNNTFCRLTKRMPESEGGNNGRDSIHRMHCAGNIARLYWSVCPACRLVWQCAARLRGALTFVGFAAVIVSVFAAAALANCVGASDAFAASPPLPRAPSAWSALESQVAARDAVGGADPRQALLMRDLFAHDVARRLKIPLAEQRVY